MYDSSDEYKEITQCYQVETSRGSVETPPTLMILNARIRNERTKDYDPITLFLDCGSQTSFITKLAAERLGLPIYNHESFTVITFGGQKNTEQSGSAKATLKDLLNKPLNIILHTKSTLTTLHRIPPLTKEDRSFVCSRGIDPSTIVSNKTTQADILIGIDYFWDIVSQEQSICLPSGLVLTHTRFGPVISGTPFFQRPAISEKPPDNTSPNGMKKSNDFETSTSFESQTTPIPPSTMKRTRRGLF
ncbi:hypothetical protein OESDEN_13606 [Oesophagostomum dentatum]|uniref:DUF1758 domain-containing protein n=1 Tax=Oesophagostomum dentatum TaxID=61180 RepID=A0A0B1SU09_OESDE|nr:hypothetical protein OESDEN_13606 [Oesophagostomum dentatum]